MIEINRVTDSDVEAISRLEKVIFSDSWGMNGLSESLHQKHVVMLGSRVEDVLVGYLIFYFSMDEGEIARIAVDESYRRQGVAGKLFSELVNICEEKQISKVFLEVRKSNLAAIEFYKKHGFAEDGVRKNFYTKPVEDAVLMSVALGK